LKELEPWKPLAWKVFPHAWQVRYRTVPESCRRRTLVNDCYPPPWDQRGKHWPSAPVNLAERRVRVAVHPSTQEELWPLKRLQKRMSRRWPVRQEFAAACAYARREETEVVLREFEKCYSRTVRFSLVRELVRRRETRAIPALIRMLWGTQPQLALWALGEFADDATLPVLSALLEWGYEAEQKQRGLSGALVRAIGRFGEKALPLAERELQSGSWRRHEIAVAILQFMNSVASRTMLEEEHKRLKAAGEDRWYLNSALGIQHAPWRQSQRSARIAQILTGDWKTPVSGDPIPALIAILDAPQWCRRRIAIDMLVELDNPIAAEPIVKLAGDPEWEVRASVACALRHWNAGAAVLDKLAEDTNPAVRWLARTPQPS
jgi:HEAT repeat protein